MAIPEAEWDKLMDEAWQLALKDPATRAQLETVEKNRTMLVGGLADTIKLIIREMLAAVGRAEERHRPRSH